MNPCRTRRRLAVPLLGVLMSALLAACGGQGDTVAPPAPDEQPEPWTFTDDRGAQVSLDSRPQRIVAYETAGSALWHLEVEPVGLFGGSPLADNPNLTGVDVSGIESVGEIYGEINLESWRPCDPT